MSPNDGALEKEAVGGKAGMRPKSKKALPN